MREQEQELERERELEQELERELEQELERELEREQELELLPVTISELIALLQEFPGEMEVVRDDFSMGADRIALHEVVEEKNIKVWPTTTGDKWREKVVTIK